MILFIALSVGFIGMVVLHWVLVAKEEAQERNVLEVILGCVFTLLGTFLLTALLYFLVAFFFSVFLHDFAWFTNPFGGWTHVSWIVGIALLLTSVWVGHFLATAHSRQHYVPPNLDHVFTIGDENFKDPAEW